MASATTASWLQSCRKIVAVGRNYAKHASELNNPVPTSPILFLKPSTSLLLSGRGSIQVPDECKVLHHEVELGVIIGKRGRNIPIDKVRTHIGGYVLALDMTARDLQEHAKKNGLPWAVAKGYDTFTAVSEVVRTEDVSDDSKVDLTLAVDGVTKQRGNTSEMLYSVPALIAYMSRIFTLDEGDLILTGTPEGVGPVRAEQTITAAMLLGTRTLATIKFPLVARSYQYESGAASGSGSGPASRRSKL